MTDLDAVYKFGKGVIYPDLIVVVKEPSTPENPLPFEKHLVENAKLYNSSFGFNDKSEDVEIPDNIHDLQKNYIRETDGDLPEPDNPDEDHSPEDWKQRTYNNVTITWKSDKDYLECNKTRACYRAGEDWANKENGIENHKNWFEFTKVWR